MASWTLLFLSSSLTCLVATHAQHSAHHRPDTIPESDLRPVRPHPTTTQTSIHDTFVLPDMPFQPDWQPDYHEDYEYEDESHIHVFTSVIVTIKDEEESDVPVETTSEDIEADEFDAYQDRLGEAAASATKENMSFLSAVATGIVVFYAMLK